MKFFKKVLILIVSVLLVFLCTRAIPENPPTVSTTPAKSIAAMGDSISQAANACEPYEECPEVSWSTGMKKPDNTKLLFNEPADGVISLATKISELPGAKDEIVTYNNARSYTQSSDLLNQANITVSQGVEFVTIMSGANDLCTLTPEEITSPETFRDNIKQSLTILNEGLPKSKILIASIPNIYNLWKVGYENEKAVGKWNSADLCQSMLKNPTSTAVEDQERRQYVYDMNILFNTILEEECATATNCLFDNNRVFNTTFTPNELSPVDFFHPSLTGQQKISDQVWNPLVALHSRVSRGIVKKTSEDAPEIEIVSPKNEEVVSGTAYKAVVKVSSVNPLKEVYADTQLGGVDLIYSEKNDYWFLTLDTTLAPNGLETFFSIIAVDEEGEMSVTEKVKVTVDNTVLDPLIPTPHPELDVVAAEEVTNSE